jgi:hypothetical protein
MENTIYCFWSEYNPISEQRKECLKQLAEVSECNVILVTPENLNNYLLPEHPLHPAYQYLSAVHKADYLRTYFMNFIGGGYSDIKRTSHSWKGLFDELLKSDNKWILGYKEIEGGVGYAPAVNEWHLLVGNCAYICKKNTPLTNKWYNEMIKLLDERYDKLRQNPARHPRDYLGCYGSKYPLEWNELLGRIFHRVCYEYKDKLLNTLPVPDFNSYM